MNALIYFDVFNQTGGLKLRRLRMQSNPKEDRRQNKTDAEVP